MENTTRGVPRTLGRYVLHEVIATGGMATVHIGRMTGAGGFTTTVAVKRLHPQLAADPQFAAMLLDEARVTSRVRHPNVVSTLDVACEDGELFLVMEYVHGESLAALLRARAPATGGADTQRIVCGVMVGVLRGLHAAHEATSERGEPLGIVHRDVSPQNVLVGADGVPRVLDFGIAKAIGRIQTTRGGQLKGKLAYMAPEQVLARRITRRTDVFAAGVVLWEALAGRRLFSADTDAGVLHQVLHLPIEAPVSDPPVPEAIALVVMRALEREPGARHGSALEMADALERAAGPVSAREIGAWVETTAGEALAQRAALVAGVEARSVDPEAAPPTSPAIPTATPDEPASHITGISVAGRRADSATSIRSWRRIAAVAAVSVAVIAAGAISLRTTARTQEAPAAEPREAPPSGSSAESPAVVTVAPGDPSGALPEPAPAETADPVARASATAPPRPPPARRGPSPKPGDSVRPFYGRK